MRRAGSACGRECSAPRPGTRPRRGWRTGTRAQRRHRARSLSAQLDVAGRVARLQRHRRREAEELLDRERDQLGLVAKPASSSGCSGEVVQREADRRGGRLVPGDQEDAHEAGDVAGGQPLAFHLGVEQQPNERAAPCRDERVDVGVVLTSWPSRPAGSRGSYMRRTHATQRVRSSSGRSMNTASVPTERRDGEAGDEVTTSGRDEPLEEVADDPPDRGAQLPRRRGARTPGRRAGGSGCAAADRARSAGRALPGVRRRDRRHVRYARREGLPVLRRGADVVVARDEPEAAVPLAARDRAASAQLRVHGPRVDRRSWVVVVEIVRARSAQPLADGGRSPRSRRRRR